MFAELEALVAVAETGSMERAANDLYVTPSALTRRIQRLELELGLVLLDRQFKPPKLTRAGAEVLEKTRNILSSIESLKAPASGVSAIGPFRLGVSHALARPELSKTIVDLGKQFPLLQPNICSDVSPQLLERLHAGDLDMAVVLLPATAALAHNFTAVTLSQEEFRLVQARSGSRRVAAKRFDLRKCSWVLNPAGCLIRDEIRRRVEKSGAPFKVAAELHNADLQLALIAGKVGVGMMQESLLQRHPLRTQVSVVDQPGFSISATVACVRGRHLGSREQVASELERLLIKHFKDDGKRSANE
jgi:DNA-binding transcriptional LysR family regulator